MKAFVDDSQIMTITQGGNGGDAFQMVRPKSLQFRGGEYVDAMILNGVQHGGNGGRMTDGITIGNDDYINRFEMACGWYVDYLKFTTKNGRSVGAGLSKGPKINTDWGGIRMLKIGGRAGRLLDQIQLIFIANYHPSTEVATGQFVLSIDAPGTKLATYKETRHAEIDAYQKVTTTRMDQKYSASVEGEYYVKVSATASLEIENTTTTSISQTLEAEMKAAKATYQEISESQVGITMVPGTIMQGADGKYWMYPTGPAQYLKVNLAGDERLAGVYDLTRLLDRQVTGIETIEQNGYQFTVKKPAAK